MITPEMRRIIYTLRVMGPEGAPTPEELSTALSEAEENVNDLLPEGWYCKIEEISAPGPGYVPAGMHWIRDRGESDE